MSGSGRGTSWTAAATAARLAGVAALAVAWSGCARQPSPPAPEASSGPARVVRTATVERSGDAGGVAVPATVQARQRAALASRIAASVVELPWREGDKVAAGAVVARLDDGALRSSLAAAELQGKAAGADRARMESLLQKNAATPKEVDEARARAAAAESAVAAAREALAYAVLRSPFAGTVAVRPASVGDVVSPGAVILEIEGSGGLEARGTVGADLVSRLRPGLALPALVDGQPGPLTATVRAVSAAGDPATHRFEVKADLPAAPGLRSGLFARLVVPADGVAARLVVPRDAVFQRGGLSGVFVAEAGTARLRWIAVGATEGQSTEVRAGLSAGERVVLDPSGLADGQRVKDAAPGTR